MRFTIETSSHGQKSIRGGDLPVEVLRLIRSIVANNFLGSEHYRMNVLYHPFLQCYDETSGSLLVEFWCENPEPWVDYLNLQLEKAGL